MSARHIEHVVMLGDVLVHVAWGDLAGLGAGLQADERLKRGVALTGYAIEAHQVAKNQVIAFAAADGVIARQCGRAVAKNRVGQI
ncbi:hypothetical protein D3C84_549660 [compost metagenome]